MRGPWATRCGIGRYGFLLPMDEARARRHRSLGPSRMPYSKEICAHGGGRTATELVPHFFRSLAESHGVRP